MVFFKKKFSLLALLFACGCLFAEENAMKVIYDTTFTPADGSKVTYAPAARMPRKNGVVRCPYFGKISFDYTGDTPIRIQFKIRELGFNQGGKDKHWGFSFYDASNNSVFMHTRGKGMNYDLTSPNKNRLKRSAGGDFQISRGQNADWVTVSIDLTKTNYSVMLNNSPCLIEQIGMLPIRDFSIYSYNIDLEVKDFKIYELPKETVKIIEQPVFDAKFNGSCDAVGLDGKVITPTIENGMLFQQGSEGKGVCVGGKFSPTTGIYSHPRLWKVEDGVLCAPNGALQGLDVLLPNLIKFTYSMKLQRTGSEKKGGWANISLTGEGEKPYTLNIGAQGIACGRKNISFETVGVDDWTDPNFRNYTLEFYDGNLKVTCDGKTVDFGATGLKSVSKVSTKSWRIGLKTDDIKIASETHNCEQDFSNYVPKLVFPELSYDLDKPFSNKVGGFMFWVQYNGSGELFRFVDAQGNTKISANINYDYFTVPMILQGGKSLNYIRRNQNGHLKSGNWYHIAVTWRPNGQVLFFINTFPYNTGFCAGERFKWILLNADFEGISKLVFADATKHKCVIDDLQIYHRPIKNSEVWAAYRAAMPIDMVFHNSVYPAGTLTQVSFDVAPGGYYSRPIPYVVDKFIDAKVDIFTRIDKVVITKDPKTKRIVKREFFPVKGSETEFKDVNVDKPLELDTNEVTLEEGTYRLVADIHYNGRNYQRNLIFSAGLDDNIGNVKSSKDAWKYSKLLFEKKFVKVNDMEFRTSVPEVVNSPIGTYLEGGKSGTSRMATVIPFPQESMGKLCVLEITWPDNKMRSMGLYMYRESKSKQHRDRLQGGIQAGNEYPNTGKMQTTRFMFFPGTPTYLFETRTMVNDMPAAIASIKVYQVEDPTPVLAIHKPEGMRGRHFGHVDEDQTITTNLNNDGPGGTAKTLRELMRYYAYTGQNTMHYSVLRYTYTYGSIEGSDGNGMFPGRQGELGAVFRSFAKHGVEFTGKIELSNSPDIDRSKRSENDYMKKGFICRDNEGNERYIYNSGDTQINIANPEARKLYFNYFEDLIARYAKNGLSGINYMMSCGCWKSLDMGYDDWTVYAFAKETGVKLPKECIGAPDEEWKGVKNPFKYAARYKFLVEGDKNISEKWLTWRASQSVAFIKELRAMINKYNPDIALYLSIGQTADNYLNRGIDEKALAAIPGVRISLGRGYTSYRWGLFRGKEETTLNEELYDYNSPQIAKAKVTGSVPLFVCGAAYYETFTGSPSDQKYGSYFQNADVKPWGRYYLKELVFCVGAGDAQEIVIGNQPLGTLGAEGEAREFTQAYCALPSQPFKEMGGVHDPIVGRYLQTKNGTYFYVVNMHHCPMTAQIDMVGGGIFGAKYINLSSNQEMSGNRIELKPFQLRSFLVKDKAVSFKPLKVMLSEDAKHAYDKRLSDFAKSEEIFDKNKLPHADESARVTHARGLIAKGEVAEAHRLLYSKDINQMLKKLDNMDNVIKQQRTIDTGRYAVNCGYTSYSTINGKFFFPEKTYDGKDYGHFGSSFNSANRDVSKINNTEFGRLYETEAYDVDGYTFNVKPGKYLIRLYTKCGWKSDYKPNWWMINLYANNEPFWVDMDLYQLGGGDYDKALVIEKEVEVTGNLLTLNFVFKKPKNAANNYNSTIRMANAIEVIRVE